MRLFSRRRPATPPDPLLTKARIAVYLDRHPGRVTGYVRAAGFPEPDELLDGDVPVWRQSTIRAWWVSRGRAVDKDDGRRYHRPLPPGLELTPELLEDEILELSPETSTASARHVHVRVYRAMDGAGPVVLLGLPGWRQAYWPHSGWERAQLQLLKRLKTDVESQPALWLLVHAEHRYGYDEGFGILPEDVTVSDLDVHPSKVGIEVPPVTPADVARLIGRPFDVWPGRLHTIESILARKKSGTQDSEIPTRVPDDKADLLPLLSAWHTVRAHATEAGDAGQQAEAATLEFAAGVLAAETKSTNDRIARDLDWLKRVAESDHAEEPAPDAEHVRLAVVGRPDVLTPREAAEIAHGQLDPPLVRTQGPENLDATTGIDPEHLELREDGLHQLEQIRHVIQDPDLVDPRYDALVRAERLLASKVHEANPGMSRSDRLPEPPFETSAESQQMQRYLGQLEPVEHWRQLPRHLQRRARSLAEYRRVADWSDPKLLLDPVNDLVALVGHQPPVYVDEDRAIEAAERDLYSPIEVPTPAEVEALARKLMASKAMVFLEWPRAVSTLTREELRGQMLVAPGARFDVERPVFLQDQNGRLAPLTTFDNLYRGFVWGVSSTDTLSPSVHNLMVGDRQPAGARGVRGENDWRVAVAERRGAVMLEHLAAGPLEMPLAPIVEVYDQLPAPWEATAGSTTLTNGEDTADDQP